MFEIVETGAQVDKAAWEKRVERLREELLEVQYENLAQKKFPVVLLINGVDGASKSETVSLLTEWMDPRHIHAHALGAPTEDEQQRPPMWRFWKRLPARGDMGIFFGSWHSQIIVDRAEKVIGRDEFEQALAQNVRFEQMLMDEGALVLKFWFHLSKHAQKQRLTELSSKKKTAWRVSAEEWRRFGRYDRYRAVSEQALRATDSPRAPWILVEGADLRHASLLVGETLLGAMRQRLDALREAAKPAASKPAASKPAASAPVKASKKPPAPAKRATKAAAAKAALAIDLTPPSICDTIDLTQALSKKKYEKELVRWQRDLALITRDPRFAALSPVVVFEGMDAAGKGGAIRRITSAVDARLYQIVPIAAPSDEERAQPYLWRFWRRVPRDGKMMIFDRSWYGRVLVERVEGFCSTADYQRAYEEINDFESQLEGAGSVVVKFWLQVSQEEQLRRFKERETVPWKRFKITPDDWRNRAKWGDYQQAASDMLVRTSTDAAPWTLVAAEDKYHARIKVLRTLVEAIEDAM